MAGLSVIFKAVDEISSKFDAMSSAGTRALDAFDRVGNNADQALSRVTQGTSQAADAMDRAAESTDYWTDAVGNYNRDAMQAVWTTEELVEMGYMTEDALSQAANAVEGAGQGMDQLGEAADRASRNMEDLGEEAERAGERAQDAGDKAKDPILSLNDILATAGIVAALKAIAGAFEECSQAAAEFETNVAKVGTVADTTILSTDQLSRQISELSMDTAKNVNELADATYNAISAGVDTADAVSTVGDATKLATAGFTSSSSALSVLTTAMNAYQLEASEVTKISDSLILSQNLGVLTIDQMANSMGKAISTASAYNVNLYNLESGYISLTKAGISVEESTTYISSMMNELGKSGSKVATVLMEETGMSFGQLMEQGYSLADVLSILYDSVDKDSEALMNLWGSAEAGKAGNAIINQGLETFNANLGKLENSAGTTQKAYEAMTSTTAYSTEKMNNSFHNLSIAIGDDLNPVVSNLQNGISNVTDRFTALIMKHPAITAVFTGLTATVAVLTLGLGGYTLATKAATLATAAWTAVMNMNPVFLAITAVTALTAGLVTLAVVMAENTEETERLTVSSRKQAEELDALNDEYERTVELYGENSEEAIALERNINSLTAEFEANRQTVEEYAAAFQESMDAYAEMTDKHREQEASMQHETSVISYMVNRLEELANQTDLTVGEQQEMLAIIKDLNEEVPGLSLSYDQLTGSLSETSEAIRKLAEAEVAMRQYDTYNDQLIEKIAAQATLEAELTDATDKQAAALQAVTDAEYALAEAEVYAQNKWRGATPNGPEETMRHNYLIQFQKDLQDAQDEYEMYCDSVEQATSAMEENKREITRISEEMARLAGATDDAAKATDGYSEAVNIIEGYKEQILDLCNAYDASYESALQSIEGQYKLWDKVSIEASYSLDEIKASLESQKQYWDDYYLHLSALSDRANEIDGLDEMLKKLDDGSEESAAMLAMMSDLDDADLSDLAKQFTEVQQNQKKTADSMAELETEFSEKMDSIKSDMQDMVDELDLSEEAKTNAMATMDAYVDEIEAGVARAQKAIDSLEFANNTLADGGFHDYNFGKQTGGSYTWNDMLRDNPNMTGGVASVLWGYADGTNSAAPGVALVGEEGPELVKFGGGEIVYPADETANILSRDRSDDDFYVAPADSDDGGQRTVDKTINLRIEGSGEMRVGGNGVSKEDIVNVLMENVKDALMNIVQQEIIEEGEFAYEF